MATRATVAQRTQIGLEATPGTAIPATKVLQSLSVELSPSVESTPFRPRGFKYPTVVAANKEWSEGDLEGVPTYDEVVYPLASVFGMPPAAVQIMDGEDPTGAFMWTFDTNSNAPDVPATYTVEQGDATRAERSTFVTFTDFGLAFSRDEVGVSGSVIGTTLDRTNPLTIGASAVATDLVPILPGQVCVYVSDNPDDLGDASTHLPTVLSVEPSVGGKYGAVWFLNCLVSGFSGVVEQAEPEFTLELTAEANADGMQWADLFRTGATRFVRIEATGPQIMAGVVGTERRLTWDMAVKVQEPGEYSDEDGVYAVGPTLVVVHDATWGKASRVEVVNTVASL